MRRDVSAANCDLLEHDKPAASPAASATPEYFRYVHETGKFHLYANMLKISYGKDPEKILGDALKRQLALSLEAVPRVGAVIAVERERRRKGDKAGTPWNETHRKKLLRTLCRIAPGMSKKVRTQFLASLLRPGVTLRVGHAEDVPH